MSVWLCIPSAKPTNEAQQCLNAWRDMGYRTAIWRDLGAEEVQCDLLLMGKYPGYAVACNALIRQVAEPSIEGPWLVSKGAGDPDGAQWFVCAGDDIWPDPSHTPDEIARECEEYFSTYAFCRKTKIGTTFGVMQPTGDPWADSSGRMIERIAGSPWIGREFALRMYGGNGPYYEGYHHNFLDNELMDVAKKYGMFWQRPDLTHLHRHWTREGRSMPPYLALASSPAGWDKYQRLYLNRRAAGFPGCEPLAMVIDALSNSPDDGNCSDFAAFTESLDRLHGKSA